MYSLIRHGKRCTDSQNLCSSRVISVKLLQNVNAFSQSFSTGSKGKILSVETKLAESISSKETPVLNVLRSYGFTDSQMSSIISTYPRLLTLDAEKSLLPKLKALQSRGASSSELVEIVSMVPMILEKRGPKSTGLYYDLIRDIIGSDKEGGDKSSFCDSSLAGKQENKLRNISVLRELGVPQRYLFKLLLAKSQPVCGKEKFEESVKKVVEMGFDPTSKKFVEALHVVYELSEKKIQEKVDAFKRLGFAEEDVLEMVKKWPYFLKFSEKKISQTFETLKKCGLTEDEVISVIKKRPQFIRASEEKMTNCVETFLGLGFSRQEFLVMFKCLPSCIGLSAESVKKKVEFLVQKMDWPLQGVVVAPPVLGYSLEKRIKPRCNVIRVLIAKGLIGGGNGIPPMSSVLTSSNQIFLKRYVSKHGKLVPELMALFTENGDPVSLTKGPPRAKKC